MNLLGYGTLLFDNPVYFNDPPPEQDIAGVYPVSGFL